MKIGGVISLVAVLILLAVGGYLLFRNPNAMVVSPTTPSSSSSGSTPPSTTSNPGSGTSLTGMKYDVNIMNFAFSPQTLTITQGGTVIWTNSDSATHAIISDSGSEINSGNLATGISYSHTFTTPGTYTYHCSIHPSMTGTIIVQPAAVS